MRANALRSQFNELEWLILQSSLVLVCRGAADGPEDDAGWSSIDSFLAQLAVEAAQSGDNGDLPMALLATLADHQLRIRLISELRQFLREGTPLAPTALTELAGSVVDQVCDHQAFNFRATLTLLGMAAADEFGC